MGFTAYYGFAPRIFKGNDHRVGFGFRFGNHADLQILYEFGPQTSTKPLKEIKVPSAPLRQREARRPVIDFLLRTGILTRLSYRNSILHEKTAEVQKT
ncbi:uncharacterized protein LOC125074956 [Vanessa atalanta]|uniref:uncharacterized protein LOC125074956 n=1 Tax=Vanessa atalanta TaxID=42275 RepID=UPI001FCDEAE2|nr:uncharacterized protein LOC125074956 [Vanessa atalanta]